MSETHETETQIAAVVTERSGEFETNASRQARHGKRKNLPEPVFEIRTSTTGHYSANCPQIGRSPIVARNVPMTAKIAGLPCEWCEPGSGAFGDPAVAEAFNSFESRRQGNGQGHGHAAPTSEPEPTEKQIGFFRKLAAERGITEEAVEAIFTTMREGGKFTKRQMSRSIDTLMASPKVAAPAPAPAASATPVPAGVELQNRPNRYAGRCVLCGGQVGEGEGRLGKQNGRWIVAHNDGACVERQTAETAPKGDGYEPKRNDVHFLDGDFYRIHISQRSQRPYAVKACVECEALWDAEGNLTRAGEIDWDYGQGRYLSLLSSATLATAEQAQAFGRMVGRCCFCSTPIDTPESIAAGYGPKCAADRGLPWGSRKQEVNV